MGPRLPQALDAGGRRVIPRRATAGGVLDGWCDPSNVRRIWRRVRDHAGIDGLVSHTLRKTVASFLDDAAVPTRKISDQLGHARVSMTQDH
jgi:integrase